MRKVMTPFPYAVQRSAKLGEARLLMHEHRVRHLPVVDGHELVGVLTDRDVKLFLGPELGSPDPGSAIVEDAYQPEVYAVDLDTPLGVVAHEMARRHIGSAVVTRKGKLAGVFTATDACRYLGNLLAPPDDDDAA